ncbi:hypothetical protein GGR56DRAFT_145813 [Xylariaceae sp. FL0804]|nr:hypothetical protein GGR56DRAFT_145813 [Xylariaceae sp. FL0804]
MPRTAHPVSQSAMRPATATFTITHCRLTFQADPPRPVTIQQSFTRAHTPSAHIFSHPLPARRARRARLHRSTALNLSPTVVVGGPAQIAVRGLSGLYRCGIAYRKREHHLGFGGPSRLPSAVKAPQLPRGTEYSTGQGKVQPRRGTSQVHFYHPHHRLPSSIVVHQHRPSALLLASIVSALGVSSRSLTQPVRRPTSRTFSPPPPPLSLQAPSFQRGLHYRLSSS